MRPEGKSALKDSHIVSVVIPTIGRPSLASCREALEQQTRLPDEIIVVEDEERRGAAWARNEGICRSRGDLLAFTDDDCVPPKDWLERLIGAVDRFNAAGAGGLFTDADPLLQDIRHRRERRQGWTADGADQIDEVGLVGSGGNVLYRRDWLKVCEDQDGYVFNESFRISQDWELAWRLRQGGARLIFVPTRVAHVRYVSSLAFLHLQFTRGIGIAMLFKVQRAARTTITIHKSLLWEKQGALRKANWLRALWFKVVGPFDVGSFTSLRNYGIFWLGEKFQAAGFLWGLVRHRGLFASPAGARRASLWR